MLTITILLAHTVHALSAIHCKEGIHTSRYHSSLSCRDKCQVRECTAHALHVKRTAIHVRTHDCIHGMVSSCLAVILLCTSGCSIPCRTAAICFCTSGSRVADKVSRSLLCAGLSTNLSACMTVVQVRTCHPV